MHVSQVFIVFDNSRTFKVSWTCSRIYGMCCEFLGGSWGLFGTVLGVFGPFWALFGPKDGLRVPQERSKSSLRARFSKIMLSLQRGLDFEAVCTRHNSRNPERTAAKRLLNRFAHSAWPSCVCCVLSLKKSVGANIVGRRR